MSEIGRGLTNLDILSESENERIFASKIIPLEYPGLMRVESPRALFVAAQPRAGKSTIESELAQHLSLGKGLGSVAVVDIDRLRPYHPAYASLTVTDPTRAALATNEDAWAWKRRAQAYAQEVGAHIIDEGTMRDSAQVSGELADLIDGGYQAELHVLAVPELVSRVRAADRYVKLLATGKTARYVSTAYQTACFDTLRQNVGDCARSGVFSRIVVYSDEGRRLFAGSGIEHGQPDQAVDALRKGQETSREVLLRLAAVTAQILRDVSGLAPGNPVEGDLVQLQSDIEQALVGS